MIGIIATCFGKDSHTFLRREIEEAKKYTEYKLYGIRENSWNKISDADKENISVTDYLYPLSLWKIYKNHMFYMKKDLRKYIAVLKIALWNTEKNLWNRFKILWHFIISLNFAKSFEDIALTHLHSHFMNVSSNITLFASLLTDIPFSITIHSAGIKGVKGNMLIHEKLKYAKFLFPVADCIKEEIGNYGDYQEKTQVVHCGIDVTQFPLKKISKKKLSKTIKIHKIKGKKELISLQEKDFFQVIFIGRFVEKKGIYDIIKICDMLKKKKAPVHFKLIGDGPYKEKVEHIVYKRSLGDYIQIMEFISSDQVIEELLKADVLLVPSITSISGEKEGIPVIIMEAFATGTPVIGTYHAGIPEIIDHQKNGLLVEEKDHAKMIAAIERISSGKFNPEPELLRYKIITDFNIKKEVKKKYEMIIHG